MRGVLAALFAILTLTASPGVTQAAAQVRVPPSDTPVGRQVDWLLDVSRRLPVSATEAREHLSPSFLAAVDVAAFNEAMAIVSGPTGLTLLRYREPSPRVAEFIVDGAGTWQGGISVDVDGLIDSLSLIPYLPPPASWTELDRRLRAVAPDVSLLAARLDDRRRCAAVHGLAADTARPIGSAFKLYVLGALAERVHAGRAGWDEPLAIREDWKSLPSGVLQDLPAGTELPLRRYADNMIAISDNTATDHLIGRLGRPAVELQQYRFGMSQPRRNAPFLTTREFFILKLADPPRLLNEYAGLRTTVGRRLYLHFHVDPRPLPSLADAATWTSPRGINEVEWFASPADVCRAFAGLDRQAATPGLEPVAHALSLNDGGLWLDPAAWTQTWFKGGSEPGVLTLNYLARSGDGGTYVVSVMVSNPEAALPDATVAPELLSLIRGAFALAAAPTR